MKRISQFSMTSNLLLEDLWGIRRPWKKLLHIHAHLFGRREMSQMKGKMRLTGNFVTLSEIMVLSGLCFSSWQAWLTGIYFVKKPWGVPSPTGFCFHPYVIFAFTLNIISYAFLVDCQIKTYPISEQFSLTERIMADAVIFVEAVFDIYFRFNFYRLNYRLAELLTALEQPKYKPLNDLFRKCWKTHKIFLWVLSVPRYILAFVLVCAYGGITSTYPDMAFLIPRYWYFTLFTIFTAIPHVTSVIFAYDLIVITTFHMLWTFEDYCAHLEDHIFKGVFLRKKFSLNPSPSVGSLVHGGGYDKENTNLQRHSSLHCPKILPNSNELRHLKRLSDVEAGNGFEKMSFNCFVERFDWINGLADKYDRCIGPIILGVVVRCVFSIVHSVNAILLKGGTRYQLKTWYHVLIFLVEASQLVILKLGSEVHERISFWKGKLTKAWLLTTAGGSTNRFNNTLDSEDLTIIIDDIEYDNDLVQDLVNYVCTWNWKVSAAGIFDIDKSLMSGIVSTTLTYVVILFQLNLAESSSPQQEQVSDTQVSFDLTAENSSLVI